MAGLSSGRVNTANGLSNNIASSFESKIGFVYDVILDENNTYAKEQNQFSVFSGCIKFRTRETSVSSDKELPIAYPFDKSFKNLPIKNEIVEILKLQNGVFYYRRITPTFNPSVTATATAIKDEFAKDSNQKGSSQDYNNVSTTGISNTNQSNDSKPMDLVNIMKLKEVFII